MRRSAQEHSFRVCCLFRVPSILMQYRPFWRSLLLWYALLSLFCVNVILFFIPLYSDHLTFLFRRCFCVRFSFLFWFHDSSRFCTCSALFIASSIPSGVCIFFSIAENVRLSYCERFFRLVDFRPAEPPYNILCPTILAKKRTVQSALYCSSSSSST